MSVLTLREYLVNDDSDVIMSILNIILEFDKSDKFIDSSRINLVPRVSHLMKNLPVKL